MIELSDTEETYEVAVIVTVPVKRLLRVKATSESHSREVAKQEIVRETARRQSFQWSIPSVSRDTVKSDQELLGPLYLIHYSNVANSSILTGMSPTKVKSIL